MTLKTVDSRQWRMWSLKVSKQWDELYACPSLQPKASFLAMMHGGETQTKPNGLPELRIQGWESRETKAYRVYMREESCIENSGDLWGELSLSLSSIQDIHVRNYLALGKNPQERFARTILRVQTVPETVSVPTSHNSIGQSTKKHFTTLVRKTEHGTYEIKRKQVANGRITFFHIINHI